MKFVAMKKNDIVLFENIGVADSFITRFMGLMFRRSLSENSGLHIIPCNQIHMFNMKFPIDVLYLDTNNKIVRIDRAVQPWKVCKSEKKARSVVEINSGAAASKALDIGDEIVFEAI